MQLYLYKTKDSNKVLNKTLTNQTELNINLKRDTDIIRPTLQLMKVVGVDFKQFNYAHIPDLNRYYFINYVESVNNSVDKLHLECDVLETYKADILASEMTYTTDAKDGDLNLTDVGSGANTVTKLLSDVELIEGESIIITTIEVEK